MYVSFFFLALFAPVREADFLRQIVGGSAGEVLQPPYIGVHEAGFAPPQEAADK